MQKKVPESTDMFNIRGVLLTSEPMWRHTTFGIGGPADFFASPEDPQDVIQLLTITHEEGWPLFILGGGSNILVSDRGIRGLVLNTRRLTEYRREGNLLILGAGLDISDAAWKAGTQGQAGLEYFFGMPGSIGGAIWMNARCYGGEIADILEWADIVDLEGRIHRVDMNPADWAYKISPFQTGGRIILRAAFRSTQGNPEVLRTFMKAKRNDRETKGHFRYPCAGSAFKNNRLFNEPSGVLIQRCGLKGLRIGGAAVSTWHGNIFINDSGARAEDIQSLIIEVRRRVEDQTGCRMEPEIVPVGDWPEGTWEN